ncbi:MAG: Competence protein ComM [Pedosphaera sp.]|nr:Competence protein ComM [Pedosphaera sp.]
MIKDRRYKRAENLRFQLRDISAIALLRFLEKDDAMLAKVCSAAVNGIEAYPVEVEVNAGWGDTNIIIVVNNNPAH